jgi:MFS family permease
MLTCQAPLLDALLIVLVKIFQGLAPSVIGNLADSAGRRPAYTICFVIYIGANIGLALQNNYAALFVLRCIQSSGSSGTIALSSGVVSDIATVSERGKYLGFITAGSLLGPAIGPVVGGVLVR